MTIPLNTPVPPANATDQEALRRQELDQLFKEIYSALRQKARAFLANYRSGSATAATAIVNELYVTWDRQGKEHGRNVVTKEDWYRIAGAAIRNVLLTHHRTKAAKMRGGDRQRVDLIDGVESPTEGPHQLDVQHEAIELLGQTHPELKRLVDLKYAGRNFTEIAEMWGVTDRTVRTRWKAAKTELARILLELKNRNNWR